MIICKEYDNTKVCYLTPLRKLQLLLITTEYVFVYNTTAILIDHVKF